MKSIRQAVSAVLIGLAAVGCEKAADEPATVAAAPHPGEQIWIDNCKVCHGSGLAGAPIVGRTDLWEKRVARGKVSMLQHALEGWGFMPARGGNPDLTDEDVEAAVDYMLAQLPAE